MIGSNGDSPSDRVGAPDPGCAVRPWPAGRVLSVAGGSALILSSILPSLAKTDHRSAVETIAWVIRAERFSVLDISLTIALTLPYLLGGLVLYCALGSPRGRVASSRSGLIVALRVWLLLACAVSIQLCVLNLGYLDGDRLRYLVAQYLVEAAVPLAAGVTALLFLLVLGYSWRRRDSDRLAPRVFYVGSITSFNWFAYYPLYGFSLGERIDDIGPGLWLALVASLMILAGTWLSFRDRMGSDIEVEREFGPREGHRPEDRRAL